MTTKPKARKFRIKRNAPAADTAQPDAALQPTDAPQSPATAEAPAAAHAAPKQQAQPTSPAKTPPQPAARAGEVASQKQVSGELDINAIRREGLTGRQLRMARRVAEKHNLAPTSDFDAVRLLRAKGIDPFQRSNMLELVVPQNENDPLGAAPTQKPQKIGSIQLPQTVPGGNANLPSTELSNAETREKAISQMQRDISRRRRRRLGLLLVRLCFFVLIPTFAAGYYFNKIATPMYATDSQFLIIQNEGGGGASPFGGLLPTQFANSADSIATQAYLQSKDAMLRLDEDAGFKEHFADENIDPIQRLDANATTEEAYKTYKKRVKIGYDPTEGVIRMEVIASDPAVSAAFSQKLLKYAEERVNDLSSQKRQDGMRDALEGFEKAQQNRRNAQEALIRMQVENGVDPEAVIGSIRAQIGNYETLLIEKELELAALLDNARPNRAKVDGAQGDVRRLTALIERLETKMSSATDGENSLAEKAVTMQLAMADLAAADVVLQASQTAMEQARTEANRQVRYLTIAVEPVAPEEAAYPRKFENTLLTFLIFAGVYLMLSLTASILREQITS